MMDTPMANISQVVRLYITELPEIQPMENIQNDKNNDLLIYLTNLFFVRIDIKNSRNVKEIYHIINAPKISTPPSVNTSIQKLCIAPVLL